MQIGASLSLTTKFGREKRDAVLKPSSKPGLDSVEAKEIIGQQLLPLGPPQKACAAATSQAFALSWPAWASTQVRQADAFCCTEPQVACKATRHLPPGGAAGTIFCEYCQARQVTLLSQAAQHAERLATRMPESSRCA